MCLKEALGAKEEVLEMLQRRLNLGKLEENQRESSVLFTVTGRKSVQPTSESIPKTLVAVHSAHVRARTAQRSICGQIQAVRQQQ